MESAQEKLRRRIDQLRRGQPVHYPPEPEYESLFPPERLIVLAGGLICLFAGPFPALLGTALLVLTLYRIIAAQRRNLRRRRMYLTQMEICRQTMAANVRGRGQIPALQKRLDELTH